MDNEQNRQPEIVRPDQQSTYKPGEKGFAVFMLLVGLFFTWQSVLIYARKPGASSCGAVPLFCSVIIDLLAVLILITEWKKGTVSAGEHASGMVRAALRYLAPLDIVVVCIFVAVYCVALYLGLGFMIVTPVFLWGTMTFLSRGNYIKNILWTVLCMVFIYLVFRMLFSVILP